MSVVYEPPVLNQRSSPDETLWEGVVTYDTTASTTVRVYARTREDAVDRMTDRDLLARTDPTFTLDENWVDEFYSPDDHAEPVTEEDS